MRRLFWYLTMGAIQINCVLRSMLMMEMMKGMRTKRMVRMTRAVTPAMTPNMSLGGIEWGGTSEGFLLNPKT